MKTYTITSTHKHPFDSRPKHVDCVNKRSKKLVYVFVGYVSLSIIIRYTLKYVAYLNRSLIIQMMSIACCNFKYESEPHLR